MANKEQYKTVREFIKTSLNEISLETPADEQYATDGNCYESAASYIMDNVLMKRFGQPEEPHGSTSDTVLVHAEVTGQGHIEGLKYGHAWVEVGGIVIDNSNGNNIKLPIDVYYRLGQVGSNIYKYTPEETRRWILDSETYGPWELETESGY